MEFKENPYAFFNYLRICKKGETVLISEVNHNTLYNIKPMGYYKILTFKTYICELVYNAINLFPTICEYTITCKNELGTSYLTFKIFQEIEDDGHPCMAQYKCTQIDEEDILYNFNLQDIKKLYCNNRYHDDNSETVNTLVVLLYMGGEEPTVSTSYKINPDYIKNTIKFKN